VDLPSFLLGRIIAALWVSHGAIARAAARVFREFATC